MNAFSLLGLDARYDLDPSVIERAFFERTRELHPDRHAAAPAAERVAVLARSRALNDAYQIVKRPVARAEYLLAQAGVTIGDNEQLDPAFLMEILDLREELAAARVAGRTEEVARLERAMKQRRTTAVAELGPMFAAHDLAAIKRTLIVLRYLDRYLEECAAALDEED
jgi:molecular chaperone HscB